MNNLNYQLTYVTYEYSRNKKRWFKVYIWFWHKYIKMTCNRTGYTVIATIRRTTITNPINGKKIKLKVPGEFEEYDGSGT